MQVTRRITLTLSVLGASVGPLLGGDFGQYSDVPANVRAWFKSIRSPNGMPCCDIADGHRTTWRGRADGGYEVQIDGQWFKVPPEAVIPNAGNPTGDSIVWYSSYGGRVYIRCFVPGGGV